MQELRYCAPTSLTDAIAEMASSGARALAGGTDLIPQMREGRRAVETAVDLKRVPELQWLARAANGSWRIGAAVTIGELGRNAEFATEHDTLLEAARLIGSLQIQNRASLGGNVCNAAPSADAVPLLISLGAQAEIAGPGGPRVIPVSHVAVAPGRTSLAVDEVLVAILLPAVTPRSRGRYLRFTPRREMDIAIAGAATWIALDDRGMISDARITLASVAPTALVAETAQRVLVGQRPSRGLFEQAAHSASADARPISDSRGSAEYRRELVKVLTRRALEGSAIDLGCAL